MAARLVQQLAFVTEVDKLKGVLRQTLLMDASRRENSAEHSWHVALMALVLLEYAPAGTDLARVLQLLLVHDIVEIDAGDTFAYDAVGYRDKDVREQAAAAQLFGLLPDDQHHMVRALWDEFERGATDEARFANALDRLQPLLNNLHTDGGTWREHHVTRAQVLARMAPIASGAPELWPYVLELIDEACAAGLITE